MKTFKFLMVAAVAVPALTGPAFAQAPKPTTPPAHAEDAAKAAPKSFTGELVMADVVLKPGKTLSADELIAYCRRSLANYKIPRRVEFSDTELPKSGSGKILKRLLRDAAWARQERAVACHLINEHTGAISLHKH